MPVFIDRLQRWRDDVKGRLAQVAVIDVARGTAKGAPLEITRADDTAVPRRGHVDGKTGGHGLGRSDDVGVGASGSGNDDPATGSSVAELHIVTLRTAGSPARDQRAKSHKEKPLVSRHAYASRDADQRAAHRPDTVARVAPHRAALRRRDRSVRATST